MPTYSYECESCGKDFELSQRMTDPPADRCPDCGGPVRRKIGSGAGIIFKGSGFYATDYRSSEYKTKQSLEKGESKPSSSKKDGPASPPPPAPASGDGGGSKKD